MFVQSCTPCPPNPHSLLRSVRHERTTRETLCQHHHHSHSPLQENRKGRKYVSTMLSRDGRVSASAKADDMVDQQDPLTWYTIHFTVCGWCSGCLVLTDNGLAAGLRACVLDRTYILVSVVQGSTHILRYRSLDMYCTCPVPTLFRYL